MHNRGFDFSKFNAETVELDLRIGTAQKFNKAFCFEFAQIAGAVYTTKLRMLDKRFTCFLRIIVVALRQSDAANVEIALNFWRTKFQLFIENIKRLIFHRITVRDTIPFRAHFVKRVDDGPNSRFGGATETDEICRASCVLCGSTNVKWNAVARK